MRAPRIAVVTATVAATLVALAVAAPFALAKEGGLVTLAAPIPRDAQPGSTLTVTFTVTMPDENGHPSLVTGSPMVLKLTGPDGTTTEAMGVERDALGTYVATIRVPSSGIQTATFGMRGTGTMADGTSAMVDLPFDVDGVLFTTTAHPAPAADTGASATTGGSAPTPTDYRAAIIAGLLAIAIVWFVAALLIGRRRALRSA